MNKERKPLTSIFNSPNSIKELKEYARTWNTDIKKMLCEMNGATNDKALLLYIDFDKFIFEYLGLIRQIEKNNGLW